MKRREFFSLMLVLYARIFIKPGLHEYQLPVERSVTLVSSIEVDRRRCALQVSSVARLQENKVRFTRISTAS